MNAIEASSANVCGCHPYFEHKCIRCEVVFCPCGYMLACTTCGVSAKTHGYMHDEHERPSKTGDGGADHLETDIRDIAAWQAAGCQSGLITGMGSSELQPHADAAGRAAGAPEAHAHRPEDVPLDDGPDHQGRG